MSKRVYKLMIIDAEKNDPVPNCDKVFEHVFEFDAGKIRFLPATNKMAKAIKEHASTESE